MERLEENVRFHTLEKEFQPRVVLVTSKENEPMSSSRADPRHRSIEILASDLGHHHVAKNDIERIFHNLAQAFDAARD